MKRLAIVLGTRPEIIKLAPLVSEFKRRARFALTVISTGQHDSMASQMFQGFEFAPDVNLNLMLPHQSPNSLLASALSALDSELRANPPNAVIVQGDTTSALGGALAAFQLQIPVAHIEAGLRTGCFSAPFPEEMNRCLISRLSDLHFCHTEHAKENLLRGNVSSPIFVVGNTVVDALKSTVAKIGSGQIKLSLAVDNLIKHSRRLLLVTGHRRENFDRPLENLCAVLSRLEREFSDLEIVYPVHLNPNVQATVRKRLGDRDRIHLLEPLAYPDFLALMQKSVFIISDSGGVQEEAPTLCKKVLVTRVNTERPEAAEAGWSEVIPADTADMLFHRSRQLLAMPVIALPSDNNPYGDGTAAVKIVRIVEDCWV